MGANFHEDSLFRVQCIACGMTYFTTIENIRARFESHEFACEEPDLLQELKNIIAEL